MNKKGFTLVELLATIVIIAILIMLASFGTTTIINNAKIRAGAIAVVNLKESAVTYYKQNNINLSKCNAGFMVDEDNTSSCITSANEITVKELIEAGAFTDTKNICDKNATVTVYRYVDPDSGIDELRSYVDDSVCNATDTKNQVSNNPETQEPSSTNACSKYSVTKYGDGDLDGNVTSNDMIMLKSYLTGQSNLTCQAFKNFDLNDDGKVNELDLKYLQKLLLGENINFPVKDYVWRGDVNEDGTVDIKDLTLLRKYLDGTADLTPQGLKNADLNDDGGVNEIDRKILNDYLGGKYDDYDITEEPLESKTDISVEYEKGKDEATWQNDIKIILGVTNKNFRVANFEVDTTGDGVADESLTATNKTATYLPKTGTNSDSVRFRAVMSNGRASEWSKEYHVHFDNIPPSCSSSGGTDAWTNDSRTLVGTCTDTGGSGCAGNASWYINWEGSWTNLSPGKVRDNAGNETQCPSNQTVKIDKTAPSCSSSGGSGSWTNNSRTLVGTCSDSGGSGCAGNVSWYINWEGEWYNLSPGKVKDNAGNETQCPANQTVKVDKTPPTYNISVSGTAYNGGYQNSYTISVSCSDNRSGIASGNAYETKSSKGWNNTAGTCRDNAGNTTGYSRGYTIYKWEVCSTYQCNPYSCNCRQGSCNSWSSSYWQFHDAGCASVPNIGCPCCSNRTDWHWPICGVYETRCGYSEYVEARCNSYDTVCDTCYNTCQSWCWRS